MRIQSLMLLALMALATSVNSQSFDRKVTAIHTDEDGVYHAAFMYWFTTVSPFDSITIEVEFVILGEVVSIETVQNEPDKTDFRNLPNECRTRLKVLEVTVCPDALVPEASKIQFLETWECSDVDLGDSVFVFMTRYEGEFAIPCWRGTNTPIGYRVDPDPINPICDARHLADLMSSGHAWDLDLLTSEELYMWRCIDSDGLLLSLIRAKEMEEENQATRE